VGHPPTEDRVGVIYLSGVTSDRYEPDLIARGVGLMIQPGNSYHLRVDRYPYWAADNGCFQPATYIGDDAWLDWLDRLPRERCLFAVVPDVARRPDGSLGGDPVATWAKFEELAPIVQAMGFPAALAAQDGIEDMPNLREQLDACDVLFLAGSTEWKLGPQAEWIAHLARAMGKWVHMGRVNSLKRMKRAREMGCNSADGTFIKYRRRKRAGEDIAPEARGTDEIGGWLLWLDANPPLFTDEMPSLPVHRAAALTRATLPTDDSRGATS
jgi:hypothetical protein